MNRVITIFDIGDLYHYLKEDAVACLLRHPDLRLTIQPDDLVVCWFRYHLRKTHHLAVLPATKENLERFVDWDFLHANQWAVSRFYNQLKPLFHNHHHPCFESWCDAKIRSHDLTLTFYVGPADYSALPAQG